MYVSAVVKMKHGSIEICCELSSVWLCCSWIIHYWGMFKMWLNLQQWSAGTKATSVETHINKYVRTTWALQATCMICLWYCIRRVHPSRTDSLWPIPIRFCRFTYSPLKVKFQSPISFWSYRLFKGRVPGNIYSYLPRCLSGLLSQKQE
jgi:hypothetical protein